MKISGPKLLLHVEGLVVTIAACFLYREFGLSWWEFAALFLAPDLAMLGYVAGTKSGSLAYNTAHTYAAPFLLWALGEFAAWPVLFPICLIWIAHIGFDRLLGYGLKYETAFKDTHLSRV